MRTPSVKQAVCSHTHDLPYFSRKEAIPRFHMNNTAKPISSTIIVLFSLMLEIDSFAAAQEKAVQLNEQQYKVSPEAQEEDKDIPIITNPVVFDEKDLDKLLEKQREYVEKHYPDYQLSGKGEEHDIMDGRRYSFFIFKMNKINML